MAELQTEKILKLLEEKVLLKQDVYNKTKGIFEDLKLILKSLADELTAPVKEIDSGLIVGYRDKNEFEMEFMLADELLVFVMHTNIFTFDPTHEMWKSSYIQQDHNRSYCGKISIYN